jgi:PAS domain S-box-containing protein
MLAQAEYPLSDPPPSSLVKELQGLYALTDRLYRAEALQDVFEAALDAITGTLGSARASILLFDEHGVMRFVASRGLSAAYRAAVDGHSPWTAGTRDPGPILVPDITATGEPDWLKQTVARENIRALAFIPLVARRRTVGKFMIYHAEPHAFGEREVELAIAIARQVGFGVERFRAEGEQRRAEDELRLSEERFRLMSEDAPVMIWTSDAFGKCVHLNRMLRAFWDVAEDAIALFDWSLTIHPDDAPRVGAVMARALGEQCPVTVKARYRRSDGACRTIETTARPQFSVDGAFRGMIGVNIDVTEREEAERALRDSERRFRDLAETMPQLVWTADADGRVDYRNSRVSGFGPSEAAADGLLDWRRIVYPDDLEPTEEAWDRAMAEAADYQFTHRLRMSDGAYRWHISRASPVRDEAGRGLRWYGTATDIHDLRQAQDRLHDSEERQRIAVEAAGLGVFEWTVSDDTTIWQNMRMFEIVGRDPSAGPMSFRAFLAGVVAPEDAALVGSLEAHGADGPETVHLAFRIRRIDDGALRWVELAGRFDEPAAGERRLVGVLSDVTEERRAQEHRQLLVNELNHRVKNTLAVVQGVAKRTFRESRNIPLQLLAFDGRLTALAHAHDLLTRESWRSAPLAEIARITLRDRETEEERILIRGPRVELSSKQAVTLAMALHELHTNAVKYGALSRDGGRVELIWDVTRQGTRQGEPELRLSWTERGGPEVAAPTQRGFGSTMIERALGAEFQASVAMEFPRTGFVCRVTAPLPRVEEPSAMAQAVGL